MNAASFDAFVLVAGFALCAQAFPLGAQGPATDHAAPGADATCDADSDITTIVSHYTVEQTISRLKQNIETTGLTVLAVLDQSMARAQTGAGTRHQEMLVIGDPRTRALLTRATPLIALDLPMKVLVWTDGDVVKVSFKEPECLRQRYDLTPQALEYFAHVEESAEQALR